MERHGHRMAADILALELAKARQRVSRAELALQSAEELLDDDCGVGINLTLCGRIRAARRRVIDARRRMTKIAPTIMN
jgi:hypothetical protein